MPLMVSVSGIRGIIGDGLTPDVIVEFSSAYAAWVKKSFSNPTIILGRDSRVTGKMVSDLVSSTLNWCGCHVIDLGIVPTPTVQIAVEDYKAQGGIIVSASHNPVQWNALKLLNHTGEFMSPEEGEILLKVKENRSFTYAEWNSIGTYKLVDNYYLTHIEKVLGLPILNLQRIAEQKPKIVVDAVEGAGFVAVPLLLEKMGCEVVRMNCNGTGIFPHTPEPLPENLTTLCDRVITEKADLGFALDPDADRLAVIMENGVPFGEEYTITSAVDFVLSKNKGVVVSNLSTTRAVDDVAKKHGVNSYKSKVGEINVVKKMQEVGAVIGGEGSGGVIFPDSHYGRDSLVAAALITAYFVENNKPLSVIKSELPIYEMSKKKIELGSNKPDDIINRLISQSNHLTIDTQDGLKIDFPHGWVQMRKSNTEPIVRIYSEAKTKKEADKLAEEYVNKIKELMT